MNAIEGVVLIVDDESSVRESLSEMLSTAGIASVCYDNGQSLLDSSLPDGPACLLLDLRLPGEDGIIVQDALSRRDPKLPIIFLSGDADVPSAVTALKHGAFDFLEKGSFLPDQIIACVASALRAHKLSLDRRQRQSVIRGQLDLLTPREKQVARLVAAGNANKVVAIELGISERTVEIHRRNLMQKLNLHSVTELAKLATQFKELRR